jgi:hypothetical protein
MGIANMSTSRAWGIIGRATLIAGGLDFLFASVVLSGGAVARMWQVVASGVFGRNAFSMGMAGALWGVLFHFLIMGIFSAFMFLVYRRTTVIARWPLGSGLAYGICIWLVMKMLVVPLSRAGNGLIPLKVDMIMNIGFLMHLLIGVVIVVVIKKGIASPPPRA